MGRLSKEAKLARAAAEVAEAVQAVQEAAEAVAEANEAIEPAPAPVAAPTGGYAVRWSIKVNGRRYADGDTADLTAEQAVPFLASGAIAAKG